MLSKPNLRDEKISDWLRDQYGLRVIQIVFLPTNYENTAAYRVIAEDKTPYFLKLRRDVLDENSITVPVFLKNQGVRQIIEPIAARSHLRWAYLDDINVILYPFVEGHNAFKVVLSEPQWFELGAALKGIHSARVPAELRSQLQHETYSREWCEKVEMLQERAQRDTFNDPFAAQLAEFMTVRADEILHLVRRTEQLGSMLKVQSGKFVLCHSDIHAGNILCDANGSLYIVDWDDPIMAPKERDLMFIGGGVGGIWHSAQEEALFYRGYGQTEINPIALTYYRFNRILQDIGIYAEQLLLTASGSQDRMRTLQGIVSFFLPNRVVEMAYKAEKTLPPELRPN